MNSVIHSHQTSNIKQLQAKLDNPSEIITYLYNHNDRYLFDLTHDPEEYWVTLSESSEFVYNLNP